MCHCVWGRTEIETVNPTWASSPCSPPTSLEEDPEVVYTKQASSLKSNCVYSEVRDGSQTMRVRILFTLTPELNCSYGWVVKWTAGLALEQLRKFNPSSVSLPPSPDALAFLQSQLENVEVDRHTEVDRHAEEEFHLTSEKLRGEEIDWRKSENRASERTGFAARSWTRAIKEVDFRLRYQSGPLS